MLVLGSDIPFSLLEPGRLVPLSLFPETDIGEDCRSFVLQAFAQLGVYDVSTIVCSWQADLEGAAVSSSARVLLSACGSRRHMTSDMSPMV